MADKKKLTLSINSEVIEKAKKLGLNLSEITEKALQISSLSINDDNIVTSDKLNEAYIDVLKEISKILKKWDMHLRIGIHAGLMGLGESPDYPGYEGSELKQYVLSPNEVYLQEEGEDPMQIWQLDDENMPIRYFDDPEIIITNLINKLDEKAKENKDVLDKLQILKNILKLSDLTK
jgi:histidinol phosphatase-like PHP family hydrolase